MFVTEMKNGDKVINCENETEAKIVFATLKRIFKGYKSKHEVEE